MTTVFRASIASQLGSRNYHFQNAPPSYYRPTQAPPEITLPRVSILESDIEITPADYRAGKAGQAAAGF